MFAILLEGNKVVAQYEGNKIPKGFQIVNSIPGVPEVKPGFYPVLCFKDNEFYYEYEQQENINLFNYEDTVNNLIRKKYSLSQELSLLRQKDEKPEDYSKYFLYCEECKNKAKSMFIDL